MGRIACAYVARFELAILARTTPRLWERVLAVADLSAQRARLLAVTPAAERHGLRAGVPINEALALCPALELRAPDPVLVQQAQEEIRFALGKLSPAIDYDGLGAFFVAADNLEQVHADELVLARRMKAALRELGYDVRIGVADRPLPAWVAARCSASITRVPPGQDATALAQVRVSELGLPPPVLERLELLGIRQVRQLALLPPGTLSSRLPEGDRIERFCRGEARIAWPTQAHIPTLPEELSLDLDTPTDELEPILFLFKSLVDRLLVTVAQTRRSLAELRIVARLDDRSALEHRLTPAAPTLDSRVVMDLLRLWLSSGPFPSAVAAIRIVAARTEVASARQLGLFQQRQELADDALGRAAARLSAAFGTMAVVRPVITDTYCPENRISWIPFTQMVPGRAQGTQRKSPSAALALRLLSPPEPVFWNERQVRRADGTMIRIACVEGPHRLCGEWWRTQYDWSAFDRSYFWVTGEEGEWLWLFREEASGMCPPAYLQAVVD